MLENPGGRHIWVTFNYKNAVRFKIILNKLNCHYWAFGLSDPRTIGPSDYWVFGLLGFRTNGLSDNWADTRFTCCLMARACISAVSYIYTEPTIIYISCLTASNDFVIQDTVLLRICYDFILKWFSPASLRFF